MTLSKKIVLITGASGGIGEAVARAFDREGDIAAIYAFIKGKEWIRIPTIIFSSILFTNVTIIMSEEIWGPHASPQLIIVTLANAPWFFVPLFLIWKMWRQEHPFSREENQVMG